MSNCSYVILRRNNSKSYGRFLGCKLCRDINFIDQLYRTSVKKFFRLSDSKDQIYLPNMPVTMKEYKLSQQNTSEQTRHTCIILIDKTLNG